MELVRGFDFTAELEEAVPVGAGPFGTRRIRGVRAGEVKGERIRGTVGTGGADWVLVGPDGWGRLDVRLTLNTHDGAHIYVQYFGLIEYTEAAKAANAGERSSDSEDHYFRACPRLETGDPRYEWVNRTVFVAQGRLHPGPIMSPGCSGSRKRELGRRHEHDALTNRAFRLRSRPVGAPSEGDLELGQRARPRGRRRGDPRPHALPLARPDEPAVDQRHAAVLASCRARRGDARDRHRSGGRVAPRRVRAGALVSGYTHGRSTASPGPRQASSRFPIRSSAGHRVPRAPRPHGPDGLRRHRASPKSPPAKASSSPPPAGAVGSIAGQIAKAAAPVVGIAGGAENCRHVVEDLGFDAWVDRTAADWRGQLVAATPKGMDVDFENVGGEVMDHVLLRLNFARPHHPLRDDLPVRRRGERLAGADPHRPDPHAAGDDAGFIVTDHADRFLDAIGLPGRHVRARASSRYEETIVQGFEQAPGALRRLFTGEKTGKLLVHVADQT